MTDPRRDAPSALTVKDIFNVALTLAPPARAEFIARACAGDTDLRARVEKLLAAYAADFLTAPTADMGLGSPSAGSASAEAPATPRVPTGPADSFDPAVMIVERAGSRIGPYKLLQSIGEGGFGSVFMADQEYPVRRRVALKIIKLGMDTRQVVARFEQERQALAMMDHPNIARVLDAGATETGRPYFVMELVKGEPVTTYCDRNSLTIGERLELFTQICHAVQHAHTKGVIHRDLKPSNILVGSHDGRALVKIIDFGISKATQQRLTEKTVFTEFHQMIGTPEYMSPEQAAGSLDLDTRTDVYSLGVLLYELLTGTTPFDPQRLRSAAFAELQRLIRELDPPRPSTRLSQQQATIATVAAQRRVEPRRLNTLLKGDLDWVVMKALDKDRGRRYDTPGALAADIANYLAGRPVQAAPPSTAYRLRKFVRRHRVPVLAGSIVAAALLIGAVTAAVGYLSAVKARDAEVRSGIAERAERRRAQLVARFLEDILTAADPEVAGTNRDVTVRQVLDAADAKLAHGEFEGDPASEITARGMLAKTYGGLGAYDRAEALLAAAQLLADRTPGLPPAVRAELAAVWSGLRTEQGRPIEAEQLARRALEFFTEAYGPDHIETATAQRILANTLIILGKHQEAVALLESARAIAERHPDDNSAAYANILVSLAETMHIVSRSDEAIPLIRKALEISRSHHDEFGTLDRLNSLAVTLAESGHPAEADPYFREALDLAVRILGDEHPLTAKLQSNSTACLVYLGRADEAEHLLHAALERSRAKYGTSSVHLTGPLHNLAAVLDQLNRPDEAKNLLREAIAIRESNGQGDTLEQANSLSTLATLLFGSKDTAQLREAETMLRTALRIRERELAADDPLVGVSRVFLGACLVRLAEYAEAEPLLIKGLEGQQRAPNISPASIHNTLDTIIKMYARWDAADPGHGHADQAAAWQKKLDDLKRTSPEADPAR